jgi:methionyl-tRNA formyltransferase
MRIAFFGSPDFSVSILENIHKTFPISLVVTQPDKKVGRKQILTATPVKQFAHKQSIPVVSDASMIRIIEAVRKEKIDLAIVVAYGLILPKELLEIPKFGFINVHYSLLPKYRGASPVQWAILSGDKKTGTTIMQMDEELDHGNSIVQKEADIEINDTEETLLEKLNQTSIPRLLDILRQVSDNQKLATTVQHHVDATHTRRLTKDDGFIELQTIKKAMNNEQLTFKDLPKLQQEIFKSPDTKYYIPDTIHNFIRALYPWPGAWTLLPNGKRVKIISSTIQERSGDIHGALQIREIQVEGKQRTKDVSVLMENL